MRESQPRTLRLVAALPRFLAPKALAGTRAEPVLVVLSLCLQALVFYGEMSTPRDVTFTPYALLVVLLNAWLVGARALVVVTGAGVLIQCMRAGVGNTAWVTAVMNGIALAAAAALADAAAANNAAARKSRERQLAALLDTARALNQAAELGEVFAGLTRAAVGPATGASWAAVWQLEAEGVRVVAERDLHEARRSRPRAHPLTPALRSALAGRGARQVTFEAARDELGGLLGDAQVAALTAAPILIGGQPYGILAAGSRSATSFTSAQQAVVTGLAELGGVAIARARELEAQTTRARVLEVLREVLLATASASAPEDVAQRVVDEARSVLGADTVALALRDRERPGLWIKAATRPLELAAVEADSVLGRAFGQAAPALVGAEVYRRFAADAEIAAGAAHLAVAPVLAGPDCLGVIAAALDSADEEHLHLLALLGSQLGSAVLASELRGELVESERAFRSLCAGLGCAAVLHDAGGKIVEANWAVESLTGVSVREAVAGGVFGPDWRVRSETGADVPLSMRPPRYVMAFDRPLLGMVAEVEAPGGRPVWVRIDSNPVLERGRLKWIVTTFYPVPAPAKKKAQPMSVKKAQPAPRRRAS